MDAVKSSLDHFVCFFVTKRLKSNDFPEINSLYWLDMV